MSEEIQLTQEELRERIEDVLVAFGFVTSMAELGTRQMRELIDILAKLIDQANDGRR